MIGVDQFSSVFGGQPTHTAEHLAEHLRAVILLSGRRPVIRTDMKLFDGRWDVA